jgi:hypothetical protein
MSSNSHHHDCVISSTINFFLNEVFQILAPLLTNLVIVINAIEEHLELMMEVYTLLCVEEFVPWSYVDNLSL